MNRKYNKTYGDVDLIGKVFISQANAEQTKASVADFFFWNAYCLLQP